MRSIANRLWHGLLAASLVLACAIGQPVRADPACWTRFFGDPGSVITDMAADKQGLWVAGRLEEAGASPVLWVALLDRQGRTQWQTRLPAKGYQLYPRLVPAGQGMWVVTEIPRPSVPAPGGGSLTASELWLGRISPAGKLTLQKRIAPHRVQTVQAAAALPNGGILLAGLVERGPELYSKGWLAGLDARGRLVWQRLLPEVAWLSSLAWRDIDTWLIAGQAAGDREDAPWLAVIDRRGRVRQSWAPNIHGLSIHAVLNGADAIWLAGEWTAPKSGARLIRFDPRNGSIKEYPAQGFSVLRLLAQEPSGLLAGGDGMAEAAPEAGNSTPGWLTLPYLDWLPAGLANPPAHARRLTGLAYGELRAWAFVFNDRPGAGYRLMAAGASPHQGAWVGCMKPERIDPDATQGVTGKDLP